MSTFVSQQIFEFFVLLYGGVVAAFVYDLISILRQYFSFGKIFFSIQDILYWIGISSFSIYLLYYASLGSVKIYSFFALMIGGLLYKILLSKIIIRTMNIFINFIREPFIRISKNK